MVTLLVVSREVSRCCEALVPLLPVIAATAAGGCLFAAALHASSTAEAQSLSKKSIALLLRAVLSHLRLRPRGVTPSSFPARLHHAVNSLGLLKARFVLLKLSSMRHSSMSLMTDTINGEAKLMCKVCARVVHL